MPSLGMEAEVKEFEGIHADERSADKELIKRLRELVSLLIGYAIARSGRKALIEDIPEVNTFLCPPVRVKDEL